MSGLSNDELENTVRRLSTLEIGLLSSGKLDDIHAGGSSVPSSASDVWFATEQSQVSQEEATIDYSRVALQMQEKFGVSVTYVGKDDPCYTNFRQSVINAGIVVTDIVVFNIAFSKDGSSHENRYYHMNAYLSLTRKRIQVEARLTEHESVKYGKLFHEIADNITGAIIAEEAKEIKADKSTHAVELEQELDGAN